MNKLFIGMILSSAALFFVACTDTVSGAESDKKDSAIQDTVFIRDTVTTKDTIVVKDTATNKDSEAKKDSETPKDTETSKDSETKKNSETSKDSETKKETETTKDTIIVKDTEISKDTIIVKDTMTTKDTIVAKDSVTTRDTVTINNFSSKSDDKDVKPAKDPAEDEYLGTEAQWKMHVDAIAELSLMIDARDGHVYKTIKIGNQVWMAENLNYNYQGKTKGLDSSSFCYDNLPRNCEKYGRLYTYSAAIDSANASSVGAGCGYGVECEIEDEIIQGVCPSGWHIPTDLDFTKLISYVDHEKLATTIAQSLKSGYSWEEDRPAAGVIGGNGLDLFGFTALPVGYGQWGQGRNGEQVLFDFAGFKTNFWVAYSTDKFSAEALKLNSFDDYILGEKLQKSEAASVRCVQNK